MVTTKLEAVCSILRENIVNGNIKPGTRLIIRKIAKELNVSEIPIREAIRSLEAQGLVTMIPHAGAHVSMLDKNNLREIIELRSILEGYAARSAIPVSDEVAADLKVYMDEMQKCVERDEIVQFGIVNRKFHQTICQQTNNKRMLKMLDEMISESERARAVFTLSDKRSKEALKEHEEIFNELLAGNKDMVEQLVRKHRQKAGQALINSLEKDFDGSD